MISNRVSLFRFIIIIFTMFFNWAAQGNKIIWRIGAIKLNQY